MKRTTCLGLLQHIVRRDLVALGLCASLGGFSSGVFADPIQLDFDSDACDRTDVSDQTGNAVACVGFVDGNDSQVLGSGTAGWNNIDWTDALASGNVDPSNYNQTQTLGLFGYTDWQGAIKCEDNGGNCDILGLEYDESAGTITVKFDELSVNSGSVTNTALSLKQGSDFAVWLFDGAVSNPVSYTWNNPGNGDGGVDTTVLSHVTLLYRTGPGEEPGPGVPVPAPLALLGLGGLIIGWRARRSHS